jgi:hypothetical protein
MSDGPLLLRSLGRGQPSFFFLLIVARPRTRWLSYSAHLDVLRYSGSGVFRAFLDPYQRKSSASRSGPETNTVGFRGSMSKRKLAMN